MSSLTMAWCCWATRLCGWNQGPNTGHSVQLLLKGAKSFIWFIRSRNTYLLFVTSVSGTDVKHEGFDLTWDVLESQGRGIGRRTDYTIRRCGFELGRPTFLVCFGTFPVLSLKVLHPGKLFSICRTVSCPSLSTSSSIYYLVSIYFLRVD